MLVGSLILAGGRSRRMGKPKESLPLGENTMLGHTADLLLECTWPVWIVRRDADQELPPLPLESEVIQDATPGAGPLAAMAAGMRHALASGELTEQDALLVVGCDHPFLTAGAVGWLAHQLGAHQAVMARVDDVLQPLCALYRLNTLATVEELLREGVDTPRTLAERVDCRVLEPDVLAHFDPQLRWLRSVNTPEDYQRAAAELAGG